MVAQDVILKTIKDKLPEIIPPGGRVLLFGSQARNDAKSDSDWDLLILLEKQRINNDDFDEIAYPLIELGWNLGAEINPLLYTFKDWAKRHFTPFYNNVEAEGVELWH